MDLQLIKKEFRSLQKIYTAILITILLFSIAAIVVNKFILPFIHVTKDLKLSFRYIIIFSLLGGIPFSYFIFESKNKKLIETMTSLIEKFKIYKKNLIIKLVILELIATIAVVLFLFSRDIYLLSAPLIIIILLLVSMPTVNKLSNDLQLTDTELEELYQ